MGRIQAKTRPRNFNVREEISAASSTIRTKRENGKEEDPVLFLMKRANKHCRTRFTLKEQQTNRKSQESASSAITTTEEATVYVKVLDIVDYRSIIGRFTSCFSLGHYSKNMCIPTKDNIARRRILYRWSYPELLSSNAEAASRDRLRTASVESKIFQIGFSHSRNDW